MFLYLKLAHLLYTRWRTCATSQLYQPNRGLLPPNFGEVLLLHPPFFEFWARGKCTQTPQSRTYTTVAAKLKISKGGKRRLPKFCGPLRVDILTVLAHGFAELQCCWWPPPEWASCHGRRIATNMEGLRHKEK